MRNFIRRFASALRTIPRWLRWMLIAPVAFVALILVDGKMTIGIFFLALAWHVIRERSRTPRISHRNDDGILDDIITLEPHSPVDVINPSTGLRMTGCGGIDVGGNMYGC